MPEQTPVPHLWDLPVRLFHWAIVGLLIALWVTGERGLMEIHQVCGIAVLVLVVFRIAWGFAGGRHARFSDFVRGPRSALAYAGTLFDRGRHAARPPGHNPVGGWMVLLLLLLMAAQAGTGLFAQDDVLFEGPLAHLVSDGTRQRLTALHEWNFQVLKWAAFLHIGAAILYLAVLRENLIWPMITGTPRGTTARSEPRMLVRAVLLLAAAAAIVLAAVFLA